MRAMAVIDYAKPLVEIDVPEPELRPGTALLEVLTCGVCFSDVKTSRGQMPYSATLALPHIPGHEICARVLDVDPAGVFEPGELVVAHHYWPCGRCRRCRAGDENLCLDLQGWLGFTHHGGFQERLVVPVDRLLRLPHGIDPVTAAPMTCALGTAYRATVTKGGASAGATVAVIGLGGVGIHAVQVAAATGASAVGLDVSERAIEAVEALGLRAFDARRFDRQDAGLEAVSDEGFDTVIVTAGAEAAYRQAATIVRKGGRIVAVGYALETSFELATPRLVLDEIEVLGSRYITRGELERAIELVRTGQVKPIVDEVRPLDEVNDAYDDLAQGRIVGRTVLRIAKA
jgi:D-arabinose 1-dehydrogenase-like Zn-dependent alcohol dehydrogenase